MQNGMKAIKKLFKLLHAFKFLALKDNLWLKFNKFGSNRPQPC